MKRAVIVLALLFSLLLVVATRAFADEEASVEPPAVALSKEDQEVIAMLELLEMMALLQDMESVMALEDNL